MEKQILTIKQAAKLLQVNPNTIYRWARVGRFPASKIGKEWRVLRTDVIKFIESHKKKSQFFTEQQEAELITALIGRREIPLKFEYFDEGADRYTSFQHPKEYGGESEIDILADNRIGIRTVLGSKNYNLLDIGCGDGKKAAHFIDMLKGKTEGYFPLDLSRRMLEISMRNIDLAYPNLLREDFQDDFEQGNIANVTYYLNRRYKRPNLMLFLGQTIGNISDAHRVLINISESMTDDDILIVGLSLYNPKNIPVDPYNVPSAIEVMWTVPERIGIKRTDAKIYWTFNKERKQLECQLEFLRNWSQIFNSNLLKFPKNQKIRLAISRRFTKEVIFELFANSGFKIESLLADKNKDNVLVVARPHTWEKH